MSNNNRTSMGLRSMMRNKENLPRPSSPPVSHNLTSKNESDDDYEPGMRVGKEYQAVIPDVITENPAPGQVQDRRKEELRIWAPETDMANSAVDEYLQYAKINHGYSIEQALGMLYWHGYNVEKAKADLRNFAPYPNEWSMEDEVLFEQAFDFHGKHFHQIRSMLPDKTIGSLVCYYYTWKKKKGRVSLLDRQARRSTTQRETSSGDENDSETSDSDFEPVKGRINGISNDGKTCANCGSHVSHLHATPKGTICNACYQYWRRTGMMRNIVKTHIRTDSDREKLRKHKRHPPKGMKITREALLAIAKADHESDSRVYDNEIVRLKSQIQRNKQTLSELEGQTAQDIERYRLQEVKSIFLTASGNVRSNARWTSDELILAVEAVRRYGKDYRAIAEVVGNKTVNQCRNFFVNYRRRFNLLQILEEYEAKQGKRARSDSKENENGIIMENEFASEAGMIKKNESTASEEDMVDELNYITPKKQKLESEHAYNDRFYEESYSNGSVDSTHSASSFDQQQENIQCNNNASVN